MIGDVDQSYAAALMALFETVTFKPLAAFILPLTIHGFATISEAA